MKKFALLPLLLLFHYVLFANEAHPLNKVPQTNQYQFHIDLNKVDNDQLTVEVIVPKTKGRKTVYYMPKLIPGTYSIYDFGRFVSNFKAYKKNGKPLKVKQLDDNSWEIKRARKLHRISYTVEDTYDSEQDNIPYPMSGTNIEKDKNIVLNTHGFFGYLKDKKSVPYQLTVDRPENFYGSTGLIATKTTKNQDVFNLDDYMQLVDSPIMYNEPDTTFIKVANADVLVSVYSPSGSIKSAFLAENIQNLLMAQKDYLGGQLPVDKYAFIMYFAGMGGSPVSGALEHSYSSFYYLPDVNQEQILPFVVDVSAHEFFHIVTPLNIHSEEIHDFDYNEADMSKHLWMYEGVTEYFAGHVQVQYGIIDSAKYLEKLNSKLVNSYKQYDDELPFTEMSEQCVGEHKEQYGNVYEKGALIGMCIDIQLRNWSKGEYGLVNLMQDLSDKYGKKQAFKDEDLFDEIARLTFPEITDFFDTYVAGPKVLPYQELLTLVGMNYSAPQPYMGYSPLGGASWGFNQETFRLKVQNADKMNIFGEALGLQKGDELSKINGEEIPLFTLREYLKTLSDSVMQDNEPFALTIQRKNEAGDYEEVELSAATIKVELTKDPVIDWVADPTAEQVALRKAWLYAKKEQ